VRGSGREKGFDFGFGNGLFGADEDVGRVDGSLMVGAATDMDGTPGTLMAGIEELSFTWIEGVLFCCDVVVEPVALVRLMLGVADCDGSTLLDPSCFNSAPFGFQSDSKLTIGRPGLSLTTVGIGNLGLRSLSLMLVAFRMSSPRISTSFRIPIAALVGLASLSLALAEPGGVGGRRFTT
jgi:hypothetical protein